MEFLFLLLFLVSGLGYSLLFKIKIEQGVFLSLCANFLLLFIFGLLNILNTGFITVVILSILLGVSSIFIIIKEKTHIKTILTPGIVVLVLAYTFYYFITKNAMLHMWDEASHWGTSVKHIYGDNALWTSGLQTIAPAIIHYLMSRIARYNEASLYLSQWFMQFTCISMMLSNVKWADYKKAIVFAIGAYASITCFVQGGALTLYSDMLLGIFVVAMIISWYLTKEIDYKKYIWASLGVFMLVQIKNGTGTMLVIFFIAIALILETAKEISIYKKIMPILLLVPMIVSQKLWSAFQDTFLGSATSTSSKALSSFITSPFAYLTILFILIGTILLYIKSKKKIDKKYMNLIIISLFVLALICLIVASYQVSLLRVDFDTRTTITSFISAFNTYKFANIPMWLMLIIIFVLNIVLIIIKENRKINIRFFATIWILTGIYLIGILLIYLLSFSNVEAIRAASFDRYAATAMMFAFLPMLTLFLSDNRKTAKSTSIISASVLVIALVILMLPMPKDTYNLAQRSRKIAKDVRGDITVATDYIKSVSSEDEKVFVILQGDDGYLFNWYRYEMAPYKMNGGYWTFNEGSKSPKELFEFLTINNYRYVYVHSVDEYFSEVYEGIFDTDISNSTLYRVGDEGIG